MSFLLLGASAGARPKVLVQVSSDFRNIIDSKKALQDGFEHYIIKFASRYDSLDSAYVGKGTYPTLRHLEQLAKENGIQNYQNIIEKVKKAVNKWQT